MKHVSISAFLAVTFSLTFFNLSSAPALAAGLNARQAEWRQNQAAQEQPVNLSRSGTASQPRILALADGRAQVFWIDHFDGMMTAKYDGQKWSDPQKTNLPLFKNSMPLFFLDSSGWINVFWLEPEENKDAGFRLIYSQIEFGKINWNVPKTLARNVLAFDVSETKSGTIVAYIQGQIFENFEPGVYVRRNYGMDSPFLTPESIQTDFYYRALTSEKAHISIAASQNESGIYLVWSGSRNAEKMFSTSTDRGKSWAEAILIQPPVSDPGFLSPNMLLAGDAQSLSLFWQNGGEGSCAIYQQKVMLNPSEVQFMGPQKVSQLTSACPQNSHLWSSQDGGLWLWGEGTDSLNLLRWGNQDGEWPEPYHITCNVPNEGSQNQSLQDLHASLAGDNLLVVGSGSVVQDVWVQKTPIESLMPAVQEKLIWTDSGRIESVGENIGDLSVGLDTEGITHAVWSQKQSSSANAASIYYVQVSKEKVSRTVEIIKPFEGSLNPHPSLQVKHLADENTDYLHLVWSGGQNGGILYTQAPAQVGLSPAAWSSPRLISANTPAVWPQIINGPAGWLYVIYVVPLNEARGVYLTYSKDNGKNWSEPIQIFDAAKAGWPMVDHPSLSISGDGILHAAWVQRPLPYMGGPLGIYYARSFDGGQTWSTPVTVADAGYDWPTLVSTKDKVHLIYLQTSTGNLFQNFLTVNTAPASTAPRWSVAFNILNYLSIVQADSLVKPYSISASLNAIYLTGVNQLSQDYIYSAWTDSQTGEASWSHAETVKLPLEGDLQVVAKTRGCLSTLAQSGTAAIVYLEEVRTQNTENGASRFDLVTGTRSITADETLSVTSRLPLKAADVATGQPEPTLAITQESSTTKTPVVKATPIPTFGTSTQSQSLPVLPPVLGGILAAAVIVLTLAFRVFWSRKQS